VAQVRWREETASPISYVHENVSPQFVCGRCKIAAQVSRQAQLPNRPNMRVYRPVCPKWRRSCPCHCVVRAGRWGVVVIAPPPARRPTSRPVSIQEKVVTVKVRVVSCLFDRVASGRSCNIPPGMGGAQASVLRERSSCWREPRAMLQRVMAMPMHFAFLSVRWRWEYRSQMPKNQNTGRKGRIGGGVVGCNSLLTD